MQFDRSASALLLLLLGAAAANGAPQAASAADADSPRVLQTNGQRIRVVQMARGLVSPWSLAFLPGGKDILVTERPGRLRIIHEGVLNPEPVWVMPPEPLDPDSATSSADRLHMLALHPQFAQNGLVYFSYIKWGERGNTLALARGRFDGAKLTNVQDIFVADTWVMGKVPNAISGGRILFGPDGTLYLTVGDRDPLFISDDASQRMKAQDLGSDAGKTLRLRDDGSIPSDNPFVNKPGAKPEIYTYGHRNGYGLAFQPVTGALWQAEIGPFGGDELNILIPGRNYGWPLISMGRNYTGNLVSDQPWSRPGLEMPQMFWSPVMSPSSILFYTGDQFPIWKGSLFIGALTTKDLRRIPFNQQGKPTRVQDQLLTELGVRIRDVAQGPDGNLYVATEARINDNSNKGTVLRIEPAK
jgi:aldose sugar dehydrogenase